MKRTAHGRLDRSTFFSASGRWAVNGLRACALASMVALGVACTGSDREQPAQAPAPVQLATTAPAAGIWDADAAMQWAQSAYHSLFPDYPQTLEEGPYRYRYYPSTGNYVGVAGYEVFVLGTLSPNGIKPVGWLSEFLCLSTPATCGARVVSPNVPAAHPHYPSTFVTGQLSVPTIQPDAGASSPSATSITRFMTPGSYAVADLDEDGLDDVLVAPSFFDRGPRQWLLVWYSRGDGTFEDATARAFAESTPLVGAPSSIVAADFNGDGRADVFIADQGLQGAGCLPTGCPGGANVLLLGGTDHRLHNATMSGLPGNAPRVHVGASAGDADGNGFPDLALSALGTPGALANGVLLWLNDGTGHFVDASTLLPEAIRFTDSTQALARHDRQLAGATALADFDGDGRAELVTCSSAADVGTGRRTIRFYRWDAGVHVATEAYRAEAPQEVAGAAAGNAAAVVGCSGLSVADLDGDGLLDVVATWTTPTQQYVQILHRTAATAGFEDATLQALGRSAITYPVGYVPPPGVPGVAPTLVSVAKDVNGDGVSDLMHRVGSVSMRMLADGNPLSLINSGRGIFVPQRVAGNSDFYTTPELSSLAATEGGGTQAGILLYGRFVAGSGPALDLLLLQPYSVLSTAQDAVFTRVLAATEPVPSAWVYKSFGALQCAPSPNAISFSTMKAQLAAAGVTPLYSTCGSDGYAYCASCDCGSGAIGIFEVAASDAAEAASLGFAPLGSLPYAIRTGCY